MIRDTAILESDPVAGIMRQRLNDSMFISLRGVRCLFSAGKLTLTGRVPTFYLKQVAISLTEGIDGVDQLDVQIDVADPVAQSAWA